MAKSRKKRPAPARKTKKTKKKSPAGFFHGLRTAVYFVDDVEKAKEWYTQVLGYKAYYDSIYYVGFNVGGFELGLHPRDANFPGIVGSTAVYWGVGDADKAHARLLELGATAYSPIEDVGGGIRIGAVKDPFGNCLGIIENPSFKLS